MAGGKEEPRQVQAPLHPDARRRCERRCSLALAVIAGHVWSSQLHETALPGRKAHPKEVVARWLLGALLSPTPRHAMLFSLDWRHLLLAVASLVLLLALTAARLLQMVLQTHNPSRPPHRPQTDEATLAVFLGSGASIQPSEGVTEALLTTCTGSQAVTRPR